MTLCHLVTDKEPPLAQAETVERSNLKFEEKYLLNYLQKYLQDPLLEN